MPDGFNINPASRHTDTTDTLTYFQSTVKNIARKTDDKNNRRSGGIMGMLLSSEKLNEVSHNLRFSSNVTPHLF